MATSNRTHVWKHEPKWLQVGKRHLVSDRAMGCNIAAIAKDSSECTIVHISMTASQRRCTLSAEVSLAASEHLPQWRVPAKKMQERINLRLRGSKTNRHLHAAGACTDKSLHQMLIEAEAFLSHLDNRIIDEEV